MLTNVFDRRQPGGRDYWRSLHSPSAPPDDATAVDWAVHAAISGMPAWYPSARTTPWRPRSPLGGERRAPGALGEAAETAGPVPGSGATLSVLPPGAAVAPVAHGGLPISF